MRTTKGSKICKLSKFVWYFTGCTWTLWGGTHYTPWLPFCA